MASRLSQSDAERLRELEDRAEIADLVNRYGEAVRQGSAELIVSCFSADASIDYGDGQVIVGRRDILRYFTENLEATGSESVVALDQRLAATPVKTNVLISVDGDEARCESMCLAIHAGLREGECSIVVRGTCNIDDLVRTPEGWKIRRREHPAIWKFEVPGAVL